MRAVPRTDVVKSGDDTIHIPMSSTVLATIQYTPMSSTVSIPYNTSTQRVHIPLLLLHTARVWCVVPSHAIDCGGLSGVWCGVVRCSTIVHALTCTCCYAPLCMLWRVRVCNVQAQLQRRRESTRLQQQRVPRGPTGTALTCWNRTSCSRTTRSSKRVKVHIGPPISMCSRGRCWDGRMHAL